MPQIKLDLPEKFRLGHPAHLMWKSEDGKRVDEVGLVYVEDGGTQTETFKVGGTVEKARRVIDVSIVPLLCQVYHLDPETGEALPEPKAAPPPEPEADAEPEALGAPLFHP